MAINTETLYRKLYDNLESKGYNPTAEDATTGKEVVPEEADFLEMDVELGEGSTPVTLTVEKVNDRFALTVYFTDEAKENASDDWYNILKDLRYTARTSGIKNFVLRNRNHLAPDMQKRTYMKKQEQLAEGYYPMGKKASYNDSVPSVKIVIEHTRQIEEGEQRFRNINRIFLENEQGERILAPTTRPGIAKVYARVIAEGDLPHGERWNHINSLVEEYSKMAGFVRATRGHQFNESAQKLVESGIQHYQSLRETLSRMIGRKGYNAYFESWTPPLMEDDADTSNLNELFVQETLDPRIESVMPILSKLQKNISEMSEVSELAEWADSLTESPGSETLAHNQSTEEKRLQALDLDEEQVDEFIDPDTVTHAINALNPVTGAMAGAALGKGIEKAADWYKNRQEKKALAKQQQRSMAEDESLTSDNPVGIPEEDLEESGLQAYLGNKKYGKEGMDALRKAGREHAGKEKMEKIRDKYDKLDEVSHDDYDEVVRAIRTDDKLDAAKERMKQRAAEPKTLGQKIAKDISGPLKKLAKGDIKGALTEVPDTQFHEEVDMGQYDAVKSTPKGKEDDDVFKRFREKVRQYGDELEQRQKEKSEEVNEDEFAGDYKTGPAGQWRNKGPKANKPAQVGDLVGASESTETDEEAITESEGRPYVCVHAKKGECNVTANSSYEAAQKAAKKWGLKSTSGIDAHVADKPKDPASLEEGQEDLDAILRLIK